MKRAGREVLYFLIGTGAAAALYFGVFAPHMK